MSSTLCWICLNAYANKCNWINSGEPVRGWSAKKVKLKIQWDRQIDTYSVSKCPNYICDDNKRICPACGKKFITKHGNKKYCSDECRVTANSFGRGTKRIGGIA